MEKEINNDRHISVTFDNETSANALQFLVKLRDFDIINRFSIKKSELDRIKTINDEDVVEFYIKKRDFEDILGFNEWLKELVVEICQSCIKNSEQEAQKTN